MSQKLEQRALELGLEIVPYPCPVGVTYMWGKSKGAICPRCHVYISGTSRVVRLPRPEVPDSDDGGFTSRSTGRNYSSYGRISMHPRWFVHERCWNKEQD